MKTQTGLLAAVLMFLAAAPATAADLLVTQYKNDPSGAPYGIALEKAIVQKHRVDITGIVSGPGGGNSVRMARATVLGCGDVNAPPAITVAAQGQDLNVMG